MGCCSSSGSNQEEPDKEPGITASAIGLVMDYRKKNGEDGKTAKKEEVPENVEGNAEDGPAIENSYNEENKDQSELIKGANKSMRRMAWSNNLIKKMVSSKAPGSHIEEE